MAATNKANATAPQSIPAMLGIPETPPDRPQLPSESEICKGNAPDVASYANNCYRSVVYRLSMFLHDHHEIQLRQPLFKVACPEMSSSKDQRGILTTVKENWNDENCKISLRMNGLYEQALPIWKIDPTIVIWKGVNLIPDSMSWYQYFGSLGFWSSEKLLSLIHI